MDLYWNGLPHGPECDRCQMWPNPVLATININNIKYQFLRGKQELF